MEKFNNIICTEPWKATLLIIVVLALLCLAFILCCGLYWETEKRWKHTDYYDNLWDRIRYTFIGHFIFVLVTMFCVGLRYLLPVIFC